MLDLHLNSHKNTALKQLYLLNVYGLSFLCNNMYSFAFIDNMNKTERRRHDRVYE